MLFNTSNISIDNIYADFLQHKNINLSIVRLDKIHPIVSGNKLFKLHYFLQEAMVSSKPGILTFGGAYSNHLVATAFICKTNNLKSVGIVRGERPLILSHTLQNCIDYGMELQFISREEYNKKENDDFLDNLSLKWKNYLIVPEGGYHPKGAAGAALITKFIAEDTTHICTAIGTATTFAGLIEGIRKDQQIIGIPVLKGLKDINERIAYLTKSKHPFQLFNEYHFGGYAKKTPELINFMNDIFSEYHLPTDFVYIAKMMFAIFDIIEKGYFKSGSKIICLHTGGLQGNYSLPKGMLLF